MNGLYDSNIKQLLKNVAQNEEIQDAIITENPKILKGNGSFGLITSVQMKSSGHNSNKMVLNLIIKRAIKSETFRKEMPVAALYQREIYMYDTVIPLLRHFEQEKNVLPSLNFAKCFKTSLLDKNEVIILEDLKSHGFKMWSQNEPLDEKHVAIVINALGEFHALSFALRDQKRDLFNEITKPMDDVFAKLINRKDAPDFIRNVCVKAAQTLTLEEDAEVLEAFTKFSQQAVEIFRVSYECTDEFSVILHGDCWINNIMFCYEGENKNPTKVRLIDLQMSRYGPPIIDLVYFFYSSSSKNIIENYQQYLDIYYKSLSLTLNKLGSNVECLYPYSVFIQQWKAHSRYGLLMSLFLIRLLLCEGEEVADLSEISETGKCLEDAYGFKISKADEYNDRVKDIILHFVNNKLI